MAASIVPTDYLTGYAYLTSGTTAPANGIFIPLSTLTLIDAAEANATSGDIRKIVAALLDAFNTRYQAQTEKPAKLSITASRTSLVQGSALTIQDRYAITVNKDATVGDVSAE